MNWKNFKEALYFDEISDFIETYHLTYPVLPALAFISAIFLGTDKLFWESILILLTFIINFIRLGFHAKKLREKDDELSLIYTFLHDRIKPVRIDPTKPKEQEIFFKTKVSIIEAHNKSFDRNNSNHEDKTYYVRKLENKFQKKLEKESDYPRIDDKIKGLDFETLKCGTLKGNSEVITNKIELESLLSDSKAVVVVNTKELNNMMWVWDTLESWAFDNSEVPILKALKPKFHFKENEIAEHFKPISDVPKSLPWYLLKRANDRGKSWRTQATFNRAFAWNSIYSVFFLFSLILYSIVSFEQRVQNLRKEEDFQKSLTATQILMNGYYEIAETKKEFHNKIINFATNKFLNKSLTEDISKKISQDTDIDVEISYWFTYESQPNIFVTTEAQGTNDQFPKDKTSVIGCGFVQPDKIIEWSKNNNEGAKVWNYDGSKDTDLKCDMTKLSNSPIDNIVCATYKDVHYPNDVIGICIFTKADRNYSVEQVQPMFELDTHNFLHTKCVKYFSDFKESIIKNDLIPMSKRRTEKIEEKHAE